MIRLWILATAALWGGCGILATEDVVARVASPKGGVEALLTETNAGATTAFGYFVYLARPGVPIEEGTPVAAFEAAIRNDRASGVNLRWEGEDTLVVEYLRADYVRVIRRSVTVGDHSVRIRLVEGVEDPGAPPGGMLYNLRGQVE